MVKVNGDRWTTVFKCGHEITRAQRVELDQKETCPFCHQIVERVACYLRPPAVKMRTDAIAKDAYTWLETHIAEWLQMQSTRAFFEAVKPSVREDRLNRVLGKRGYGNRLRDWHEAADWIPGKIAWLEGYIFALAQLLGEPVHAVWRPDHYIEDHHAEAMGPLLLEEVRLSHLGPENHLRARRLLIDIPPTPNCV